MNPRHQDFKNSGGLFRESTQDEFAPFTSEYSEDYASGDYASGDYASGDIPGVYDSYPPTHIANALASGTPATPLGNVTSATPTVNPITPAISGGATSASSAPSATAATQAAVHAAAPALEAPTHATPASPAHSQDLPQDFAKFGSRTDVGYVRAHNEDSLLVAPPLFVVCDGMGGHEAGEVASEIAIQTIAQRAPQKLDVEQLGQAVEEANIAIIQAAREGRGREGMGTTCTAAMLEGNELVVAQVGDSRAYLLHNGALQQLTRDHSVVADLVESGEIAPEDARTHQWRSYITRALGLDPYMQPDLYELNVSEGDRLMLCSDGLYSMVTDDVIAGILSSEPDAQIAADTLVEAALYNGGTDNITVVVADVEGVAKVTHKAVRKAKATAIVIIALMVALIGGSIFGFSYLVNNSAYLGEQDGKVAIYKGIPGEFLGMQFSSLEEVSTVTLDSLQPGIAARVKEQDIRCDSVQAAKDLVNEYKAEALKDDAP